MVSFYPYLFISIHGTTLLIFMLLLTHLIMPINNVITQTIFMVLFTSRSLPTWGKPLDALSGISPRYLSATYSELIISPFFCRHHVMTDYAFVTQGSDRVGKDLAPAVGAPYHLPPTAAIPHNIHNPIRAVLPYEPQGLGEKQKVHHDITFQLVLAEEEATRDRRYGLLTIWVNPFSCQGPLYGGSS